MTGEQAHLFMSYYETDNAASNIELFEEANRLASNTQECPPEAYRLASNNPPEAEPHYTKRQMRQLQALFHEEGMLRSKPCFMKRPTELPPVQSSKPCSMVRPAIRASSQSSLSRGRLLSLVQSPVPGPVST